MIVLLPNRMALPNLVKKEGVIMAKEREELKNSIQKLYDLINNYPDDVKSVHEFVVYLRSFIRIETEEPLPKKEVMTLIKHYKPIVFWGIKKMSQGNVMFDLLTHLTMDLEKAEENLEKILVE